MMTDQVISLQKKAHYVYKMSLCDRKRNEHERLRNCDIVRPPSANEEPKRSACFLSLSAGGAHMAGGDWRWNGAWLQWATTTG